jgi:hypothetical protein
VAPSVHSLILSPLCRDPTPNIPPARYLLLCCLANCMKSIGVVGIHTIFYRLDRTRWSTFVTFESSAIRYAVRVPLVDFVGSFSVTSHSFGVSWTGLCSRLRYTTCASLPHHDQTCDGCHHGAVQTPQRPVSTITSHRCASASIVPYIGLWSRVLPG